MKTQIQQYTDKQICTLPAGLHEILQQKDSIIQALIQRLHKQQQQLISANALLSSPPPIKQSQSFTEYILNDLKTEGFLQNVGDRLMLSLDVTEIDNGDLISNSSEKIIVDSRCKIVKIDSSKQDQKKLEELFEKMSSEIQQIKKMGENKLKNEMLRLQALEKQTSTKAIQLEKQIPPHPKQENMDESPVKKLETNKLIRTAKSSNKIDDFMLHDPTNSEIYEFQGDQQHVGLGLKKASEYDEPSSPQRQKLKRTDSFLDKNENGENSNDTYQVFKQPPLTHTFGGPQLSNPKNRIKKLIRHRY